MIGLAHQKQLSAHFEKRSNGCPVTPSVMDWWGDLRSDRFSTKNISRLNLRRDGPPESRTWHQEPGPYVSAKQDRNLLATTDKPIQHIFIFNGENMQNAVYGRPLPFTTVTEALPIVPREKREVRSRTTDFAELLHCYNQKGSSIN